METLYKTTNLLILLLCRGNRVFCCLKQPATPAVAASSSGIKHPISERRLRQPPYQCAGFNIETLLVGSPLFKEMASQTGLNNSTLVAVGWVLFGGSFHHLPVYHNVMLLHWKKTSIVPHDSRDYLIHLFYFFFNFN